jgi:hypothetical protein
MLIASLIRRSGYVSLPRSVVLRAEREDDCMLIAC